LNFKYFASIFHTGDKVALLKILSSDVYTVVLIM